MISHHINKGKKLYCCFIDYKKAFDSIDRNNMFYKLARSGVMGKLLSVIRKLYSDVKSCVKFKSDFSEFFSSTRGVMQAGEALPPFLFSLYINDFESDLIKSVCEPTQLKDISLFLLMYADDTVLLSESKEGLQNILDNLHVYCESWNIDVNVTKTKVVVFRKGSKLPKSYRCFYNKQSVELVNGFNY